MAGAEISGWRVSPKKKNSSAGIPQKEVVGPQKTKTSRPENQDFKMADPLFCPAGLWPASMLSEEKLEKGKTIKTIMAQGERSKPIFKK